MSNFIVARREQVRRLEPQSEGHFCIYGREHLEDGKIPWGFSTVIVRFDSENEKKHELEKMCFIVKKIKGRHDCR